MIEQYNKYWYNSRIFVVEEVRIIAKVLYINGPAHGHINPTLGLVEELVSRGEKVVYFTTEEFRDKIQKKGAEVGCFCLTPRKGIVVKKLNPNLDIEVEYIG